MHLHDLLGWSGPMTHRQYRAWQEWLREEKNRPSRTDHYIMQATRESTLPYLKEGASPPALADYVLKFGPREEPISDKELEETDGPPIMTEASILEAQKQMAIARMSKGVKCEQRWVNKRGEPIPPPALPAPTKVTDGV